MNDTTDKPGCTDDEMLTREVADEQLEAAADPKNRALWTYPTTSCGGANC